jgi:hypothetical protein
MGQYPITAGVFGKALAIPGTGNGGTITTPSAWLFENQSGTLGTNYNSSQVYVGVTGDVVAILSDTVGVQDTVTSLNLQPIFSGANPSYAGFAAGSGYFTASNVGTTVVSLVHKSPANQPANLTVNITVPLPVLTLTTAGSGYTAGNAFTTTVAPTGGTGLIGTIGSITGGAATGPIATLTITKGGSGYSAGDVVDIVSAGGSNGTFTVTTAANGAVTLVAIGNNAGSNYSVGDIITVNQGGSGGNCKFVVGSVGSLLPVVGDAVTFKDVQAGSILPVAIDYVVTCPANSVALK